MEEGSDDTIVGKHDMEYRWYPETLLDQTVI
jgi:hypothetical protein